MKRTLFILFIFIILIPALYAVADLDRNELLSGFVYGFVNELPAEDFSDDSPDIIRKAVVEGGAPFYTKTVYRRSLKSDGSVTYIKDFCCGFATLGGRFGSAIIKMGVIFSEKNSNLPEIFYFQDYFMKRYLPSRKDTPFKHFLPNSADRLIFVLYPHKLKWIAGYSAQDIYTCYRPFLRFFAEVCLKIAAEPELLKKLSEIHSSVADGNYDVRAGYSSAFLDKYNVPEFAGWYTGIPVRVQAAAFIMRRKADGTLPVILRHLWRVFKDYDADFFRQHPFCKVCALVPIRAVSTVGIIRAVPPFLHRQGSLLSTPLRSKYHGP